MKLSITTPVGTFTRNTNTSYKAVVVWKSPRAERDVADILASGGKLSGVDARWAKDNCFGTTWHGTREAALKAAQAGYKWDGEATLVGVFNI